METWRQVEVAACEELPGLLGEEGPTEAELQAIRAGELHGAGGQRARARHRSRHGGVRGRARRLGGRGGALDPLRADLLGRARHGARPAAACGRRGGRAGRVLARGRAAPRARASTRNAVRWADPRRARRADHVRGQARGLRLRGAPQRAAPGARLRAGGGRRGVRRGRHLRGDEPGVRGARARPPRPRARGRLHAGRRRATATPSCWARSRSPARASSGSRPRSATCSAPRCARCRSPSGAGQKGSSAMPHKRNPIKSEQISGLARVLRGNAQAALENVALWHERDISHSSVERVILPDSTILLDYLQHSAIALVEGMTVDVERMRANLELTHGALFSQRVLLALVGGEGREGSGPEGGSLEGRWMSRDEAYRIVQELAQRAWDEGIPLRELLDGGRARARAGPRCDLRLRPLRPPRPGDRPPAGRDRLTLRRPARHPGPLVASRHVTTLADLPLIASGKVREMYELRAWRCARGARPKTAIRALRDGRWSLARDPADGRERQDLHLRRGPSDAHPRQGQGADGPVGVLVRADQPHRRQPPRLRDRGRSRGGARAGARGAQAAMLPVECVVRGYITGSGWKDYQASGRVSGIELPQGLRESERLPEPIFTPSTKAQEGHDEAIDFERASELVGDRALMERRARRVDRAVLVRLRARPRERRDPGRHEVRVRAGRERSRPGGQAAWSSATRCSRPTPRATGRSTATRWAERSRASTSSTCATGRPPAAGTRSLRRRPIPDDVVAGTRARYVEAYALITGEPFQAWLAPDGRRRPVRVRREGAGADPPEGGHPRPAGRRRRARAARARVRGRRQRARRASGGARRGGPRAARADVREAAREPARRGLRGRAPRRRRLTRDEVRRRSVPRLLRRSRRAGRRRGASARRSCCGTASAT